MEWLIAQKERGWGVSFPPGKHFMITQQHVHCLVDNAKKLWSEIKWLSWRSQKNMTWTSNVSVGDHKNLWCELHMFQLEITKICDVNFTCFGWRPKLFVTCSTSHVLVVLHKKFVLWASNDLVRVHLTDSMAKHLVLILTDGLQSMNCGVLIQNCRIKSWSKMVQNMIPKTGFAVFLVRYYSIYCPSYLGELSPHWCLDACLLVFSLAQNSSRSYLAYNFRGNNTPNQCSRISHTF